MRRDPNFHPAHARAAGRSLEDLVRDDDIMKLCCEVQSALLCNDIPAKSILDGLRREEMAGRVPDPDAFDALPDLAKALRMLERFRFVGLVEDLQNHILQLAAEFGLHPPQFISKQNDDPQGATDPNALDRETLAIVRERNATDIALYETVRQRLSARPRVTRDEIGASLLARGTYRPIAEPVEFRMTGPIPGSNWYDTEEVASGGLRWTGPLNETTLELPLAPALDFEISLHVLIAEIGDLSAHIGDAELPVRIDLSEGRMHRIAFWVPAELVARDGLTTLRFETREVFQPSATDIRLLSFLVRHLSVSRVEPVAYSGAGPDT